jgi:hypothetical protein
MHCFRGAFFVDPDFNKREFEAVLITRVPVLSTSLYSGTVKPVCVLAGAIPMMKNSNDFKFDGSLSDFPNKAIGSTKCSIATKPVRSCDASVVYPVIVDVSHILTPWDSKLPNGNIDYSADRMSGAAFGGGVVMGVRVLFMIMLGP